MPAHVSCFLMVVPGSVPLEQLTAGRWRGCRVAGRYFCQRIWYHAGRGMSVGVTRGSLVCKGLLLLLGSVGIRAWAHSALWMPPSRGLRNRFSLYIHTERAGI